MAGQALHAVVEDWRARHRVLREPCVCGGPDLIAESGEPGDILEAVRRHQIEPVHIAHDLIHGIELSAAQIAAGGR